MGMSSILLAQLDTYVRVKYPIIERDSMTWERVQTYPTVALYNWSWRCAMDVAHLANGYFATKECIRAATAYRQGKITPRELSLAATAANNIISPDTANAVNAAYSAYYAAYYGKLNSHQAVYAAYYASTHAPTHRIKFNMYVQWLVDELADWELKNSKLDL